MTSSSEYSAAPISAEQRRLIDFRPGEHFENALFALSDKQQKRDRNGHPFLIFKLRDCTGERRAIWFSPPDSALQQLDGAQLVRVRGYVDDQNPAYIGDFKIEACEPAETPADLSPFLPPLPGDHAAQRARFFDIVRAVKSTPLRALLKEIFRLDGPLWSRFETAPAAKSLHHAHRGGLLEHSGEVALLCERVASTLPHLDRDLLISAALLHDIGKLEEMESDLAMGEYTAAGRLVGHVVLGTCTIAAAIDKIEAFPPALRHELMHLVLSHHGRMEHGAARTPMCAEAIVLSLCDLMSAKPAQCRERMNDGETADFAKIYGWDGENVYLGSMRRMRNAAEEERP
jgi:3'-5' exoribonuclease